MRLTIWLELQLIFLAKSIALFLISTDDNWINYNLIVPKLRNENNFENWESEISKNKFLK